MLLFAALGVAAYLLALLATIPASLFVPEGAPIAAGGTIWRGQAALEGGGRIRWSFAPLRSLLQLGLSVDWQATGPQTALTGRALVKPGRIIAEDVRGDADGALLAAVAPELPFACTMTMHIDMPRIALGGTAQGFAGRVDSDAGSCRSKAGGTETPAPPLQMVAEGGDGPTVATIAPLGPHPERLARIDLGRDGALRVEVTPRGAAVLPFLAPAGGATVETRL